MKTLFRCLHSNLNVMTVQERSDIALIDQGGKDNNIFAYLPVERRTEEVCRHAVEKSVYNIGYVPEHL